MFGLPTQPLRRTYNYLTDWPLHNKRWIRTPRSAEMDMTSPLSSDETASLKSVNPNWRRDWKEVLLFKPEKFTCYRPVIMVGGKTYTTWFAIKTSHFTMRIGPEPIEVALYDSSFDWDAPLFYGRDKQPSSLVLPQDEMRTFIRATGLPTTHV